MSDTSSPTLELLLSEADWLRRLASHLVHDPGAAEDLVQETWMAALRAAPGDEIAASPARRRGWLSRVARRRASRGYHQRSLQNHHETDAGRLGAEEVCASPEVMAERMELQNEVAQAILKVREPYQTALYLRYYDGRSAAAVARILNVPESTIRSRLHRGREAVREILTADGKSWSAWSVALAPWLRAPAERAAASALVGGTVSGSFGLRWLAIAAGAAVILGGAWWLVEPLAAPGTVDPVAQGESAELATLKEPAGPPESATTMNTMRAVAPPPPGPSAAPSATTLLTGKVVNGAGEPASGAYIHVEKGMTVRTARASATSGSWAIPGLEPGTWSVTISKAEHSPSFRELVLTGEAQAALDAILTEKLVFPVRFRKPDGEALVGGVYDEPRSHTSAPRPFSPEERQGTRWIKPPVLYPSVVATKERPGEQLFGMNSGRPWRFGVGRWEERGNVRHSGGLGVPEDCQGSLTVEPVLPVWVSLVYGDRVLESKLVSAPREVLEFDVAQEALRELHGTVRFDVVDLDSGVGSVEDFLEGFPSIHVGRVTPVFVGLEDGLVTIYDVAPGQHRLQIGHLASSHEVHSGLVSVAPRRDTILDPVALRRAVPFTVTVLDESGAPVAASVRAARAPEAASAPPEDWPGVGSTNGSGIAEIKSVAAGEVWLAVNVSSPRQAFSALIDTTLTQELNLVVPEATKIKVVRNSASDRDRYDLVDERGVTLNSLGLMNGSRRLSPGRYTLKPKGAGHGQHTFEVGTDPVVLNLQDLR